MSDFIDAEALPQHVAIIMDGNGRWAKARGKNRIEGHKKGAQSVRRALDTAAEFGIPHLTLYAFSTENINRPAAEVTALMTLLEQFLKKHTSDLIKNETRLHIIGAWQDLPKATVKAIQAALDATQHLATRHLTLALNYGSRQELERSVRSMAAKVAGGKLQPQEINWNTIAASLDTAHHPDPDLVIRTSGEKRIGNFLLLQSAYAEYHFTDTAWPDFDREEFLKALKVYASRERRYGKTTEQIKEVGSTHS